MHLTVAEKNGIGDGLTVVKEPAGVDRPDGRDERVAATVSSMLSRIEREGMDAVLHYARELDGFTGSSLQVPAAELTRSGDQLPAALREALDTGADRTRRFAHMQRERLQDFESEVEPGVVCGQRFVPVDAVGAYLPAGRFPLLAGAFMTVGVAKAAGVPHVVAATPPSFEGRAHPAVLYSAHISGADAAFAVGGVQALAAMAFGLLDGRPADMVVGAGNAYVAEAKRQLFGRVGIDVLAGPSEVAVIADDTADPALVAADLLAQAEHGPTSPVGLVTTSERVAHETVRQIDKQLAGLATAEVAGAAWRDHGTVYLVRDRAAAAEVMNLLAPEHLEVLAEDLDWWLGALRNYGSLFLGTWSTVAYADKGMSGTNHVLPTVRGARFTGGLSVAGFLKQLTHQRATRGSTVSQAGPTVVVSDAEGLVGHRDSAQIRLDAVASGSL